MTKIESPEWTFIVTDIEVDGPHRGANSMRSFASVAVSANGAEHGQFEAVLEPLPGAAPNADTYAWFQTQPDAWAACTTDPRPVPDVMRDYTQWLHTLPQPRMFAACPLAFDGPWIDYYLRRFTNYGITQGRDETDKIFHSPGLCLSSYASAVTGIPPWNFQPADLPSWMLGDVPHTHCAIDDAIGYANLLVNLLGGRH
ncbi:hypothetical protein [Brachybacterium sp. FME24]|uniref:hypothetical protein n=1 Tax=Brachybacterium sp. FME24 TaxID=2742605 RepID=UPI00186969FD|nr:hypothetical protein [Brachybacterium sp. FME24]